MAPRVSTQCQSEPRDSCLRSAYYSFSSFFLTFPEGSLLHKKMIYTLETGGWLLRTMFSGNALECLSRKVQDEIHDPRAQPAKGNSPKRKGTTGTCLCSHQLVLRLLTAPSALLNFSLSTLTSNQCQVGRNLFCGSQCLALLSFCNSMKTLVWSPQDTSRWVPWDAWEQTSVRMAALPVQFPPLLSSS